MLRAGGGITAVMSMSLNNTIEAHMALLSPNLLYNRWFRWLVDYCHANRIRNPEAFIYYGQRRHCSIASGVTSTKRALIWTSI